MVSALSPSETVAVIGVGTMGAGIAQVAAVAGHRVILTDAAPGRAEQAVEQLRATLAKLADKGKMDAADARAAGERLTVGEGLASLAEAALVVEAAVERLDVKLSLFAELEDIVSPECLLATRGGSSGCTSSTRPRSCDSSRSSAVSRRIRTRRSGWR